MGCIVWLIVAIGMWIWGGILAHANMTQPNVHRLHHWHHLISNPAFSPGAWVLASVLILLGAVCLGMAGLCLYLKKHSD
jgi:hypothetical protein